MFFQKDYILRMIEMMGDFIRRLLAIVDERVAMDELDEVSQRGCGLPLGMLESGEPEMLIGLMEEPQRFLAANLLWIALEIKKRHETEDALLGEKMQILALLSSLREPDYLLPAADKAKEIVDSALHQLPVESLLASAILFEEAGQYAAGEDVLYAAYEQDRAIKTRLQNYYRRLKGLEDGALKAGGLSTQEVLQALDALNG